MNARGFQLDPAPVKIKPEPTEGVVLGTPLVPFIGAATNVSFTQRNEPGDDNEVGYNNAGGISGPVRRRGGGRGNNGGRRGSGGGRSTVSLPPLFPVASQHTSRTRQVNPPQHFNDYCT